MRSQGETVTLTQMGKGESSGQVQTTVEDVTNDGEDLASIDQPAPSHHSHESSPRKTYHPFSPHIIALLIPSSIFGLLTRLGLQALGTYDGQSFAPLTYVQATGCLVMGFALQLREPISEFYGPLYTAITTGFCGSLTTFSGWQSDIFNSWINSGEFGRGGLRDFMDGLGKTVFTLSISLASVIFGQYLARLLAPRIPAIPSPTFHYRYGLTIFSIIMYAAVFPAYFALPKDYRHQATAALLFAFPGALSRYILSIRLNPLLKDFPMGTFAANAVGTGLLAAFHVIQGIEGHSVSSNTCSVLQGLGDGYCGCLTTISTFAVEILALKGWSKLRYVAMSWIAGQVLFLVIYGPALLSDSVAKRTMSPVSKPLMDPSRAEYEEENISGEGDENMEGVEEQDDGYTSSTPTSTLTWISWFCSLPGHEYFCEVTEDFIEDDFNLTGLNTMVPFWKEAMEMVLDVEPDEDASKIPDVSIVESSAEMLYGLVHQRYILTRAGLQAMVDKYEAGIFGSCPRVYCVGCNVVPCGRSDMPGLDTVKLFCPNCNDIYVPPSSRFQGVDGAFFGTTFAHLFFQTYRELAPAPFWKAPSTSSASPGTFFNPNPHGGQKRAAGFVYVPRIYGFKVSERAKSGPRMHWLRLRPESPEELDMVDWRGRWIDDDDDGYDEEEEEEMEDKRMEDFDPDAADDDDDDDEEEEEEEVQEVKGSLKHALGPLAGRGARTNPTSPRTGVDGRVKIVRQWGPGRQVEVNG
ncbi:hypothetical protein D9758_008889 [Tetrapyrgos nigripes]|uniref:Casein kinase II subunit beta n=1 Tax=Tetrapyrgos nigripes TaxID=182062 RepID=A0A8H5CP47_9AGAR|nr:hypothetical protein D9758_008889 [Tetrapyrgos nigripes]